MAWDWSNVFYNLGFQAKYIPLVSPPFWQKQAILYDTLNGVGTML